MDPQNAKALEFLKLVANTKLPLPKHLENYTLASIHQYFLEGSKYRLQPCQNWNPSEGRKEIEEAVKCYTEEEVEVTKKLKACSETREAKDQLLTACITNQQNSFDEAEAKFKSREEQTQRELEEYKEELRNRLNMDVSDLRSKFKKAEEQVLRDKLRQYETEANEWKELVEANKMWISIEEFADSQYSRPIVEQTYQNVTPTTSDETGMEQVVPMEDIQTAPDAPADSAIEEVSEKTKAITIKNKATGATCAIVHLNQSEMEIKLNKFREIATELPSTARFWFRAPISQKQEAQISVKKFLDSEDVLYVLTD